MINAPTYMTSQELSNILGYWKKDFEGGDTLNPLIGMTCLCGHLVRDSLNLLGLEVSKLPGEDTFTAAISASFMAGVYHMEPLPCWEVLMDSLRRSYGEEYIQTVLSGI